MYIIIDTNEEDEIINFLKTKNNEQTTYFLAKNFIEARDCINKYQQIARINEEIKSLSRQAKTIVQELQDIKFSNEKKTEISETSSKPDCFITKYAKSYEEYCNEIRKKILEPNKLSEEQITEIGYEYLDFLPRKYTRTSNHILLSGPETHIAAVPAKDSVFMAQYEELYSIIKSAVNIDEKIFSMPSNIQNIPMIPKMFEDINLPFSKYIFSSTSCGLLNRHFYPVMYYLDTCDIKIKDEKLRRFLDFYKKTLDIYGLQYWTNGGYVRVFYKPRKISVEKNITNCQFGSTYFCDGVNVPKWLFDGNEEDLYTERLETINNADERTIFIKKIGIEKFIERGEIIDSYENYPDNEWWTKSEYKLIDMKNILIQRQEISERGRILKNRHYTYAPFLCMKNQTTGDYHLEGVSPDCHNLYDALKMRYQLLDLPSYEIKDIK